jgi:hypothetical protein
LFSGLEDEREAEEAEDKEAEEEEAELNSIGEGGPLNCDPSSGTADLLGESDGEVEFEYSPLSPSFLAALFPMGSSSSEGEGVAEGEEERELAGLPSSSGMSSNASASLIPPGRRDWRLGLMPFCFCRAEDWD